MSIFLLSGCLSFNFGEHSSTADESNREIVLLANSNNVYRLSSEVALKVKTQNESGKWVDSEYRVLIPEGWFLIDKDALK